MTFNDLQVGNIFRFILTTGNGPTLWEKIGPTKAWPVAGEKNCGVPYNVGSTSRVQQVMPVSGSADVNLYASF